MIGPYLSSSSSILLFYGDKLVDQQFIKNNLENCKIYDLAMIYEDDNDIIVSVYCEYKNFIPINVNINEKDWMIIST